MPGRVPLSILNSQALSVSRCPKEIVHCSFCQCLGVRGGGVPHISLRIDSEFVIRCSRRSVPCTMFKPHCHKSLRGSPFFESPRDCLIPNSLKCHGFFLVFINSFMGSNSYPVRFTQIKLYNTRVFGLFTKLYNLQHNLGLVTASGASDGGCDTRFPLCGRSSSSSEL